jgi:hypothetical protein
MAASRRSARTFAIQPSTSEFGTIVTLSLAGRASLCNTLASATRLRTISRRQLPHAIAGEARLNRAIQFLLCGLSVAARDEAFPLAQSLQPQFDGTESLRVWNSAAVLKIMPSVTLVLPS